jgi:hypothetical protein
MSRPATHKTSKRRFKSLSDGNQAQILALQVRLKCEAANTRISKEYPHWYSVYLDGVNARGLRLQFHFGDDEDGGKPAAVCIGETQAVIAHSIFQCARLQDTHTLEAELKLFKRCFRPEALVAAPRVPRKPEGSKRTESPAAFIWDMTLAFAVFAATRSNNGLETVRMLVGKYGADVHGKLYDNENALYHAVYTESIGLDLTRMLAEQMRVEIGASTFHRAVSRRYPALCKILLDCNADPNSVLRGRYPLYISASTHDNRMVELLVQYGAVPVAVYDNTDGTYHRDIQQVVINMVRECRERYSKTGKWPEKALAIDDGNPAKLHFESEPDSDVDLGLNGVETTWTESPPWPKYWEWRLRYLNEVGPEGIAKNFEIYGRSCAYASISATQKNLTSEIFAAADGGDTEKLRRLLDLFRVSFRELALVVSYANTSGTRAASKPREPHLEHYDGARTVHRSRQRPGGGCSHAGRGTRSEREQQLPGGGNWSPAPRHHYPVI